jgi:hypothetical protein
MKAEIISTVFHVKYMSVGDRRCNSPSVYHVTLRPDGSVVVAHDSYGWGTTEDAKGRWSAGTGYTELKTTCPITFSQKDAEAVSFAISKYLRSCR